MYSSYSNPRDLITLRCRPHYGPLGCSYRIECRIRNNTETETYEKLGIYFIGTDYECESHITLDKLPPTKKADDDGTIIFLPIRVKDNALIRDITPTFELVLKSEEGRILAECKCERNVQAMAIPTYRLVRPPPGYIAKKYNILVFGKAGSGKTSLINSFSTLLNRRREICQVGNTSYGIDHCTKKIRRHLFMPSKSVSMEEEHFFMFTDAWGLDKNNYNDYSFLSLLHGELPGGYEMGTSYNTFEKARSKRYDLMVRMKEHRKVHCVIYTITYDEVDLMISESLTKLFFDRIREHVKDPIIVLSLVDENVDEYKDDPLIETNEMKKTKKKLALYLDVDEEKTIFFGRNYVKERKVFFAVDIRNLMILDTALRKAEKNFPKIAKQRIKGFGTCFLVIVFYLILMFVVAVLFTSLRIIFFQSDENFDTEL